MRFTFSLTLSLLALAACDTRGGDSDLRDRMGTALDEAQISLVDAIAIAQDELPGATVVEADLDLEGQAFVFDVELFADGVEHELDISPQDGTILRRRDEAVDAREAAELQASADLVTASPGWDAIIAAAEAESGAVVFEVEADGDDGVLEVEALSEAGIHELELFSDGTVAKSEMSDDDAWEDEEETEDDEDEAEAEDEEAEGEEAEVEDDA